MKVPPNKSPFRDMVPVWLLAFGYGLVTMCIVGYKLIPLSERIENALSVSGLFAVIAGVIIMLGSFLATIALKKSR